MTVCPTSRFPSLFSAALFFVILFYVFKYFNFRSVWIRLRSYATSGGGEQAKLVWGEGDAHGIGKKFQNL